MHAKGASRTVFKKPPLEKHPIFHLCNTMESKNNVNVVEDDMAEVISNRMIESLNMSESSPPIVSHTGPHSAGSTEFEFQAVESRENGHASLSGSEGWTEDTCPYLYNSILFLEGL
ncbi:hypothetical protein Tsp_00129 [Trichinella spiralis]|uniref:hypothetical protein n=1 Tax=Trichinella spiralis TaxID=6334 RepID=UPI0001EFC032|nr:hypothetical protein Tsp_00129 [Trichinella spiralis]